MNVYAKYQQSKEDYLESILLISKRQSVVHRVDVARDLGVSEAAVNKAVKSLIEKGYLVEDGKHLKLTADGEALSTSQDLLRIRRQHYLGDEIPVTLWRNGEILDVTMVMKDVVETEETMPWYVNP